MGERRYPFQSGWWRRYLPFVGGFFVAGTLLMAGYFRHRAPPALPTHRLNLSALPQNATPPAAPSGQRRPAAASEKSLSPIEKFVRVESLKVGRPDPDPSKTHARLKAVARGLGRQDMSLLRKAALDSSLENDRRFMSVYLLTLAE